jgi:hypothetical protein
MHMKHNVGRRVPLAQHDAPHLASSKVPEVDTPGVMAMAVDAAHVRAVLAAVVHCPRTLVITAQHSSAPSSGAARMGTKPGATVRCSFNLW